MPTTSNVRRYWRSCAVVSAGCEWSSSLRTLLAAMEQQARAQARARRERQRGETDEQDADPPGIENFL